MTATRSSFTSFRSHRFSVSVWGVLILVGALGVSCSRLSGWTDRDPSGPTPRSRPATRSRAPESRWGAAASRFAAPQTTAGSPAGSLSASSATVALASSAANSATASLAAAEITSQALADLLYRIVVATEERDPELAALESQIRQIEAEIKDARFAGGLEFEAVWRDMEIDATRHARRRGTQLLDDAEPRRRYDLYDGYDREESDFMLRLRRSFLGPDHEKNVKIAERRLKKMELIIEKHKIRRTIHLATLRAVLEVFRCQVLLPLAEEQIALARRQNELLTLFQQAGEVLRKDTLSGQKQLRTLEEQRLILQNTLALNLNELRLRTGDRNLTLPTSIPLAADPLPPGGAPDQQEITSNAIVNRTDYVVARTRARLAGRLAKSMYAYWPRLDFEVTWNKYYDRREFTDQYRYDRGAELTYELKLSVPISSPYRSWKRYEAFRALEDSCLRQVEIIRANIENEVFRAYLNFQQARLHRQVACDQFEQAKEEAREIELVAQKLPEAVQGVAEIKRLETQLKVLDARVELCNAEHQLLLAQAQWDYQAGNSPIDEAAATYEERDRRAAERKSWLPWWMSLTR